MSDKPTRDWSSAHPDFDGHIEKPLLEMSVDERLHWLWQMMKFQHWAQTRLRRLDSEHEQDSDVQQ